MASRKNPHAVALGRKGGQKKVPKGFAMLPEAELKEIASRAGKKRMTSMSKAERVAIASGAAKARWANAKKQD